MSHSHWPNGPVCIFGTKKECEDNFIRYQARQQVALALHVIGQGRGKSFKKDDTVFGQLVQVLNGDRQSIVTGEGHEPSTKFTRYIIESVQEYRNASS